MKSSNRNTKGLVHLLMAISMKCLGKRNTRFLQRHFLEMTGSNNAQSTIGSSESNRSPYRPIMITTLTSMSAGIALAFSSCSVSSHSSQVRAQERYHYNFVHGQTALVQNGVAWAPSHAPAPVHRAMEAGNALQGKPYKWGGGHASFNDSGYDCSGTVSNILHKAGLLNRTMTSSQFKNYGAPGHGRWITIYARDGHVFMTIAGLRIASGGTKEDTGPMWKPFSRKTSAFIVRHPPGF